jgi:predicted kinase
MAFRLQLVRKRLEPACGLDEPDREALEFSELVDWADRMAHRGWRVRLNGAYDSADERLFRAFPERWAPDADGARL